MAERIGEVLVSVRLAVGESAYVVEVSIEDETPTVKVSGKIQSSKLLDRVFFREAIAAALQPAALKSRKLADRGKFDPVLLSDWNAHAFARELFRLLCVGIRADRRRDNGTMALDSRTLDPDSFGATP